MKKNSFYFLVFLQLFISSCKEKNESCGIEMTLQAPESVYEFETLNLKPIDAAYGTKTYYNWGLPDMDAYPSGFSVDDDHPIQVKNVNIYDEGTYTFRAFPKGDGCPGVVSASKYVKILPIPCPCCEEVTQNTLQITSSQGTLTMPFTPIFAPDFDTLDLDISNWQSGGPYYFRLYINTKLNKKSRTFKLMNYMTYWTGDDEDPVVQAWMSIYPGTVPNYTYEMEEGTNKLYVRHMDGQAIFTFCNVLFRHKYNSNDTFTVSGKIAVDF